MRAAAIASASRGNSGLKPRSSRMRRPPGCERETPASRVPRSHRDEPEAVRPSRPLSSRTACRRRRESTWLGRHRRRGGLFRSGTPHRRLPRHRGRGATRAAGRVGAAEDAAKEAANERIDGRAVERTRRALQGLEGDRLGGLGLFEPDDAGLGQRSAASPAGTVVMPSASRTALIQPRVGRANRSFFVSAANRLSRFFLASPGPVRRIHLITYTL